MTKHIVISGWYGYGNIGDEAILHAMIETFHEAYPDLKITVLSFRPEYTKEIQKVETVHQIPISTLRPWVKFLLYLRFVATLKAIYSCDIFVMGGGGFLSDWQPKVPKGWLKQMRLAKLFGKKSMLYGIGAGPFLTPTGKETTKKYLQKYVDQITVRDIVSYENLHALGISKERMTLSSDPVYHLTLKQHHYDKTKPFKVLLSFPEIFHNSSWKDHERHYKQYLESIKELTAALEKREIAYTFVSFMQGHDELFTETKLQQKSTVITSIEDLQELFSASNPIVLGLRFHFNLLSLLSGVPVLPVVYHHKVFSIVNAFKCAYLEVGNGENWKESSLDVTLALHEIEKIQKNYEQMQTEIRSTIDTLKEQEKKNLITLQKVDAL